MKKRILLVAVLQLFLTLNSCSSDPGDYSAPEIEGEIKADYIADVSSVYDFVTDANDNVFVVGQATNQIIQHRLQKIDPSGKITLLKDITSYEFFNRVQLALTDSEEILLIAPFKDESIDKIFRFEKNYSELNPFYTMKPVSSPSAEKIKLYTICNNKDKTFFVFDAVNRNIKRFIPELNTDVFVAGSEKNEIKDGTGLNAGFGFVSKIISQNNVLYLIDDLYTGGVNATFVSSNIRKLEFINNEWKVTTLISTTNEDMSYSDMAFDSKNNLYVLVKGKGIYKLNLQDNALTLFKDGEFKIGKGDIHFTLNYPGVDMMKIKGNDMYLVFSSWFIKISDFHSKLSK
nr:hypothetical protein [uncultured Flavobacterium sp.]